MTFEELLAGYLDSMPPRSKVNFPDLVAVVMERWAGPGTAGCPSASAWTPRDVAYVAALARKVVHGRGDLTVEKGRGICKR